MREYYELLEEKEDIVTDGGGKPSPDDFTDNEDGTVQTQRAVKTDEEEIPITVNFDPETGEAVSYSIDLDEETINDDMVIKVEEQLPEMSKTLQRTYKDRMLQKQAINEVPALKQKMAEMEQEIKRLKANNGGSDEMTPAECKEFFGVDTVEEVEELRIDNFAKWSKGNARYAASLITPLKVETRHEQVKPTIAKPQRIAPLSVPDGAGGGSKPKPRVNKEEAIMNSIITGKVI